MNYVYCGSYAGIYFALHLKNKGERVAVITTNEGIRRYCDFANIRCIRLSFFNYIARLPVLTDSRRLLVRRLYLDGLLRSLDIRNDDSFYITHHVGDYNSFFLAKQWVRKGTAYFAGIDQLTHVKLVPDHRYKPKWIHRTRFLVRLFLGLDLRIYERTSFRLELGLDDELMQAYNIASLEIQPMDQLVLEAIDKNSVSVGEYDNLLASGYPPVLGNLKRADALSELYERVFSIAPDIAIKAHPGSAMVYDKHEENVQRFFDGHQLLPTYLPAELLLKNVRKNVISIQSATLVYAAGIDGLSAISLMDLVEYKDHKQPLKEDAKRMLQEMSGDRIIFVKGFEELERLLLS